MKPQYRKKFKYCRMKSSVIKFQVLMEINIQTYSLKDYAFVDIFRKKFALPVQNF